MFTFIWSAIKIIFLLGFLIFIHEGGHFLVAKLCKVKVNEFAIGFGPVIWKKQGKETKYALRLIPLGGFVSMEGEEKASDNERSFSKASIPKRIAIVAAGATVNIIFAVIVYFILMVSSGVYISNEVDSTIENYAAQSIGIETGDKIIQINDTDTKTQKDIKDILNESNGEELKLKVERQGEILEYSVKPTEVKMRTTGIYLKNDTTKIAAIDKGSVAESQGLKTNDVITKINGEDVEGDSEKLIELINQKGTGTMLFSVRRGNENIDIEITPGYESTYYLGINFKQAEDTLVNRFIYGGMETKEFLSSIIENLKMLFTGNVGVDQMMGPVGISEVVAQTRGIRDFMYMLALISLSLGVTNLLPIPALDGGKILILLIEAIRRKPLKEELEIKIQLLGFSILIALSIFVAYNDILRIF